jgi:hypothetical protein
VAKDVPDWCQAVVTASEIVNGPTPPWSANDVAEVAGGGPLFANFNYPNTVPSYLTRAYLSIWDESAPSTGPFGMGVFDSLGATICLFGVPGIRDPYELYQTSFDFGPTGLPFVVAGQLPLVLATVSWNATAAGIGQLIWYEPLGNPYA